MTCRTDSHLGDETQREGSEGDRKKKQRRESEYGEMTEVKKVKF